MVLKCTLTKNLTCWLVETTTIVGLTSFVLAKSTGWGLELVKNRILADETVFVLAVYSVLVFAGLGFY
tara:strand:+ start:230 stop:433 length:204 start_codon:yes stop_codon:yes gene_type:complete